MKRFKRLYISCAALTVFIGVSITFSIFYKHVVFDSTRIRFENGFIYTTAPQGIRGGKVILNSDGTVAVESNVRYVEDYGPFIYGVRKVKEYGDLSTDFYFICEKNKSCFSNQNLSEQDFMKQIQSKNLVYNHKKILNPLMQMQTKEWISIHIFGKKHVEIPRLKN